MPGETPSELKTPLEQYLWRTLGRTLEDTSFLDSNCNHVSDEKDAKGIEAFFKVTDVMRARTSARYKEKKL